MTTTKNVIGFEEGVLANATGTAKTAMTKWANSAIGKITRQNFDFMDLPISDRLMRGHEWLETMDLTLIVAVQALCSQSRSIIFDKYESHLTPEPLKLPAAVKRISAFANFGIHWFRIRFDISLRRVLVHNSLPSSNNTAALTTCINWFLWKYSLPKEQPWNVEIQTDVAQFDGHSCGPITAMIMWRDARSKTCPLKIKNGPRLEDYRKCLLDQLRHNMRTLGLLDTADI